MLYMVSVDGGTDIEIRQRITFYISLCVIYAISVIVEPNCRVFRVLPRYRL